MPPSVLISPSPLKALRERGTKGVRVPYSHLSKGNASIANPPNFPDPMATTTLFPFLSTTSTGELIIS